MNAPGDGRRVMLIVGGSGSIGSAVARHAVAAGWRVVLHGRDAARLEALAAEFGYGCAAAFSEPLGVGDGAERLVARAGGAAGRIDAVVDCLSTAPAGIVGAFRQTDPAAYAALAESSLAHVQRLAHAALPWLEQAGGTLIAFVSDAGRFAAPNQAMIGAARAGTIGFVRNLAVEVAGRGVRVHCVSPSFVEGSASFARAAARAPGRVAKARARAGLGLPTPDDIAPLVLFLCGEGARRITGQIVSVNGGLNA